MTADIIVRDRHDRPLIIVETKAKTLSNGGLAEALKRFESAKSLDLFPYGIVADFELIRLFDLDSGQGPRLLLSLDTTEVLRNYDPGFDGRRAGAGDRRVFHDYFNALVEAWLRDLTYRWKSETPPAIDRLAEIGLASLLEGGATYDGVPVGGDTLR